MTELGTEAQGGNGAPRPRGRGWWKLVVTVVVVAAGVVLARQLGLTEVFSMENVDRLDRPFPVDVVTVGDIVDVCIDNRRTLITRV